MNETRIDTIKALLAKAEATDSEHEAEAFTSKAQSLMLKYGIEQAMLASRPGAMKLEQVVVQEFRIRDPYADVLIPSVYGFARNYSDAIDGYFIGRKSNDRTMFFVGFQSDLDLLVLLLHSLMIQSKRNLNLWIEEMGPRYAMKGRQAKWHDRRSFLSGYFAGAGERVRAARRQEEQAAEPGTDIVLADRASMVKQNMAERKLRSSRGARAGGADGAVAGRREGLKADLGQGNLSGGRGQLEG